MRKFGVIVLIVALALTLSACGGKNGSETPAASPDGTSAQSPSGTVANAEAEALYKAKCIACHAADLRGASGPNLQTIGSKRSVDEIADIIANGGRGMTAFKSILSEEEINTLAEWLAAKK